VFYMNAKTGIGGGSNLKKERGSEIYDAKTNVKKGVVKSVTDERSPNGDFLHIVRRGWDASKKNELGKIQVK